MADIPILSVSSADFDAAVLTRSHDLPVVVDFWAPWCGPCRALAPTLERLARESGGRWLLVKLNTDENQELARRYRIQSIPAVKAFRGGKVISEFTGNLPEPQIRKFLDGLVPSPAAAQVEAARAAEAAGDAAGAGAAWRAALALRGDDAEILLGAAGAMIGAGEREEAKRLLGRIAPSARGENAAAISRLELQLAAPPLAAARAAYAARPDDMQARYDLALAQAGSDPEAALELLLGLVKKERAWKDDASRKAMLRIFEAVGIRSPISDRWRARLSAELYR